jgi:hypothetical protein
MVDVFLNALMVNVYRVGYQFNNWTLALLCPCFGRII